MRSQFSILNLLALGTALSFLTVSTGMKLVDEDLVLKQNPFVVDVGIINGKQFYSNESYMEWQEANEFCHNMGLLWGRIDNAEENAFIANYLATTSEYHFMWLSGSDYPLEGQWRWAQTAAPMIYVNWNNDSPDGNRDENFLMMATDGFWGDYARESGGIPLCYRNLSAD